MPMSSTLASPAAPPTRFRAYVAFGIVCLVWGTTYLGIRIAIETIPPFLMTGARWTLAGALLIALLKARGTAIPPRTTWGRQALLGFLLIGLGNGAVVWAELSVPSGLAALLIAVTPFWMIGIERLTRRSGSLGGRRVAGLIIGFGGVALLVWPELAAGRNGEFLTGVVATQIAALGWAIGSNVSHAHDGRSGDVLSAVAVQMIFGGLFMLALGLALREPITGHVTARSALSMAYLLLVGSIVAYSAYSYALRHLPLATVSMYAYVTPVIAVGLGTLVLNEPFSPRIFLAGAIVLSSVVLVKA
jgi:drug/metabolite transporter (DMT)-like permease